MLQIRDCGEWPSIVVLMMWKRGSELRGSKRANRRFLKSPFRVLFNWIGFPFDTQSMWRRFLWSVIKLDRGKHVAGPYQLRLVVLADAAPFNWNWSFTSGRGHNNSVNHGQITEELRDEWLLVLFWPGINSSDD